MLTKNDIKLIRSLADKRSREQEGLFVVEGDKMVGELMASDWNIDRVFVTERCAESWSRDATTVSAKDMERISMFRTPSDSLALVRIPQYELDDVAFDSQLVLALDAVQDPGNMGTIIRLADWFGIEHIVASVDSADCFNPKTVQSTMGALFRVQVHYCDLCAVLDAAGDRGAEIYGTVLDGENIYSMPLKKTAVLVMGNEGNGIGTMVAKRLTKRLFIPPFPSDRCGSESLNVAVATAIACSEFRRRLIK